jgi:hypothetical protein
MLWTIGQQGVLSEGLVAFPGALKKRFSQKLFLTLDFYVFFFWSSVGSGSISGIRILPKSLDPDLINADPQR